MTLIARSIVTEGRRSREVGRELGRRLLAELGTAPKALLSYLTINHDQPAFLSGLRESVGEAPLIGCCTQGVMGRGVVREEGYAASVLALAGDLEVESGRVALEGRDAEAAGRALGEQLLRTQHEAERPRLVIAHWDPISAIDAGVFLEALFAVVQCPIVGGAASHHYEGRTQETFVYAGGEVAGRTASALALYGDFGVEMASCLGCSPFGVEMTVTRAEGNVLFELDGRPALDVWTALTMGEGHAAPPVDPFSMAIGILSEGATNREHLVRAAFVLDQERRGIVVGAAIPTGTRVMLHRRTVADVLDGARRLGAELTEKLAGRPPVAVLGFECGARTSPFLGEEATLEETLDLQRAIGAEAAWVGAMMWGESFPVAGRPGFHNYTFPLIVLAERREP